MPTSLAMPPWHDPLTRHARCPFVGRGKVRFTYGVPETICGDTDVLLLVAGDGISVYDFPLNGLVPDKGAVLNCLPIAMAALPGFPCQTHLWGLGYQMMSQLFGGLLPHELIVNLAARSVLIKKLEPLPAEIVGRQYLTGSGWKDYLKSGRTSVYGHKMPNDLVDGSYLGRWISTPTTKATTGHDLPIFHEELQTLIGTDRADQVRDAMLELFTWGQTIASESGIIFADGKTEWAFDAQGRLVLIDEWLTPDACRFWDEDEWADAIAHGRTPASKDKEYARQLAKQIETPLVDDTNMPIVGIHNLDPAIAEHKTFVDSLVLADHPIGRQIISGTTAIYHDIFERLVGKPLEEFLIEDMAIPAA